ncbi:MAG: tRNA (adenosine(37)-N6)-dimethylallyltransferase MiaA [Bifidobacteriaceae bacterium]|nr:tRNA (adenosine(37)-N6)-dimethylallyltransferase MiaA [Bifidobacteriaceae bacterium]
MKPRPRFIALVGATATGKSGLALDLAGQLDAELVNADSMALYRGMEIGTARTPPGLRRGIAHHQIDLLDVTEEASVAAYQRHARADIESIWQRGRTALLVGGSGLYVRAVTDVIEFPPYDAVVRARWQALGDHHGASYLHAELARRDPAAAAAILPGNLRRLVRALEVIEVTGKPFAAQLPPPKQWRPVQMIGLSMPFDQLDQRIEARANHMMEAGLIEEVRRLEGQGLRQGQTARRAIGYREALAVLDGELTPQAALDRIALATRQLARRQIKWFSRDRRLTWIDATGPDLVERALEQLQ